MCIPWKKNPLFFSATDRKKFFVKIPCFPPFFSSYTFWGKKWKKRKKKNWIKAKVSKSTSVTKDGDGKRLTGEIYQRIFVKSAGAQTRRRRSRSDILARVLSCSSTARGSEGNGGDVVIAQYPFHLSFRGNARERGLSRDWSEPPGWKPEGYFDSVYDGTEELGHAIEWVRQSRC